MSRIALCGSSSVTCGTSVGGKIAPPSINSCASTLQILVPYTRGLFIPLSCFFAIRGVAVKK